MEQLTKFAPFILMFVVIYFFMIRPQQKKAKQEKEFDAYKDHMRESQKRQWSAIDEHTQAINEVNYKLENCKLEHREREE